jgi:hypothetical protein
MPPHKPLGPATKSLLGNGPARRYAFRPYIRTGDSPVLLRDPDSCVVGVAPATTFPCPPQKIRPRRIVRENLRETLDCSHGQPVACSQPMRTAHSVLRLVFILSSLAQDALQFLLLGTRSGAAIKAENMFLRKQLALYLEREVKPRRATDATRLSLVLLSRLFAWRDALVNVKPETFLGWHRKGFQLLW